MMIANRSLVTAVLLLTWLCATPVVLFSQVETKAQRLIDRDPFDQIQLGPDDDNVVMDVEPLPITKPYNYQQNGDLHFVWLRYPERKFKVAWKKIARIRQFDDIIMDEAEAALKRKDLDLAFENLLFLYEKKSLNNNDEFRQRWDDFLALDGELALEKNEYEQALSTFEELYRRNPTYPVGQQSRSLTELISECYDKLIETFVRKFEYTNARLMLDQIKETYGKTLESVNTHWEAEMRQQAVDILNVARGHMDSGDGVAAHQAVRRTMDILPSLPEGKKAFAEVVERFPMVLVGVSQKTDSSDPTSIFDWSARRIGRLTQRSLMEYQKPGDAGGEYSFPNGLFTRSDDEKGASYRFHISRRVSAMGVPDISTYQISDRLMNLGDDNSPDYFVPWQKVVDTIQIIDDTRVSFDMRVPFVKPEAHLQIPYQSLTKSGGKAVNNGIYSKVKQDDVFTTFDFNETIYNRLDNRQHPKIVEQHFKDSSSAVDALVKGDIDVVDRIFPADARRLKNHPDIAVANYILPSIHVLIPNHRTDFVKSNNFRRALLYAINRQKLVNDVIAGGQQETGYDVITGPFPRGTDDSDQIAYAYNMRIVPREYSLIQGYVLAELTKAQLTDWERQKSGNKEAKVEFPTLVLVHPDNEVAKLSCNLIKKAWKVIGVETEVRVLPKGKSWPEDDDYDFVFTEIMMQEPITDIRKVIGRYGWVTNISAPMEQELRRLDTSINWRIAGQSLKRLHKQCNVDVTVIPLWQVVEKFAYRRNIVGIRKNPVHLYQHVDQWRILPVQSESDIENQ